MRNDHVERWLNIINNFSKKMANFTTAQRRKPLRQAEGQALVEYTLLTVLVAMALIAAITLTGPTIGNVFSNVIYNVVGNDPTYTPLTIGQVNNYKDAYATFATDYVADNLKTNTPAAPTCSAPSATGFWETKPPPAAKGTYVPNCVTTH
ncbi:MAG: hypothetical protein ABI947_29035 [Chloroflexota bacterium]